MSIDDKVCSFAPQSYQMTKCKVTVNSSALASSTPTILKASEGILFLIHLISSNVKVRIPLFKVYQALYVIKVLILG